MGSYSNKDSDKVAFMTNSRGDVCIAFADPAFVRADKIIFDHRDNSVHAVFSDSIHLLGHLSQDMADAFVDKEDVIICALHTDGSIVDLIAPLSESA